MGLRAAIFPQAIPALPRPADRFLQGTLPSAGPPESATDSGPVNAVNAVVNAVNAAGAAGDTAGSRTGIFKAVNTPELANGYWEIDYNSNAVVLSVTATPGIFLMS